MRVCVYFSFYFSLVYRLSCAYTKETNTPIWRIRAAAVLIRYPIYRGYSTPLYIFCRLHPWKWRYIAIINVYYIDAWMCRIRTHNSFYHMTDETVIFHLTQTFIYNRSGNRLLCYAHLSLYAHWHNNHDNLRELNSKYVLIRHCCRHSHSEWGYILTWNESRNNDNKKTIIENSTLCTLLYVILVLTNMRQLCTDK